MIPHRAIYDAAALYDKAFSFRDTTREVRFLRDVFVGLRGRALTSFLELAAGPARHAIELATMGATVSALDLSDAMQRLALDRAGRRGVALEYAIGDMRAFRTSRRFDLAATMLASATYILTDADFVAHLACVADSLVDDGMYVIEFPHPSALEGRVTVKDEWTVEDDDGELDASWRSMDWQGSTSLCVATLTFRSKNGETVSIKDEARERLFRLEEVVAFARASGAFEVEDVFGALDEKVRFDDEKAWRMVVVLRKTAVGKGDGR